MSKKKPSKRKLLWERAERIKQAGINCAKTRQGQSACDDITFRPGYAEPGYDECEVVAFGNWNKITKYVEAHWEQFRFPKHKNSRISKKWAKRPENLRYIGSHFKTLDETPCRVAKLLEKAGIEIEWSDEWSECDECHKAIRIEPNSYGWTRSYIDVEDGGRFCQGCIEEDETLQQSILEEKYEGKHRQALTFTFAALEKNYECVDEQFEAGWHSGMDADPKLIAKALKDQGIDRFVFQVSDMSQFYMEFVVWIHKEQWELFDINKFRNAPTDGPSNSEALRRGLQAASNAPQPQGEGVVVTKIDVSTGTATTKLVSPEDFVNGKALD